MLQAHILQSCWKGAEQQAAAVAQCRSPGRCQVAAGDSQQSGPADHRRSTRPAVGRILLVL